MKYSLIPYIRKDRLNSSGECPVNIRYTFQRKMLNIPVGVVIKPEYWDDKYNYPKQSNSYNFREIVKRIELKISELENIIKEFDSRYFQNPTITELKGLLSNTTPKLKDLSVIGNLENYIQFLTKKPKISPNTIKIFKTTKNHFDLAIAQNNKITNRKIIVTG